MKHLYLFLFPFGLILWSLSSSAQEDGPVDILFVGNSYTYFWNLPHLVDAMAEARDIEMTTRQSTAGGTHLGQHWRSQKSLQTLQIIEEQSFNFVVLQDHSLRALQAPDSLLHFGALFGEHVSRQGARPVVYITWARKANPLMQEAITREYVKLSMEIDALIAPVGPAWDYARSLRPDLGLFDPDGSHPSPLGTYLSACVLYRVITGDSPVGLPARLISKDIHGEKLYLSITSEEDATFCQQVAEAIVRKFENEVK